MKLLIGISGKAGSGKDTAACYFVNNHGFLQYAIAGPLKRALEVLGIHEPRDRNLKEARIPGRPYSYRQAAQKLGTEWARDLDIDFWLNLAKDYYESAAWSVVISDVRFENEAEFVRERGGLIIHLKGRAANVDNPGHASEQEIEVHESDCVIFNTCSIEKLYEDLENAYRRFVESKVRTTSVRGCEK